MSVQRAEHLVKQAIRAIRERDEYGVHNALAVRNCGIFLTKDEATSLDEDDINWCKSRFELVRLDGDGWTALVSIDSSWVSMPLPPRKP